MCVLGWGNWAREAAPVCDPWACVCLLGTRPFSVVRVLGASFFGWNITAFAFTTGIRAEQNKAKWDQQTFPAQWGFGGQSALLVQLGPGPWPWQWAGGKYVPPPAGEQFSLHPPAGSAPLPFWLPLCALPFTSSVSSANLSWYSSVYFCKGSFKNKRKMHIIKN